MLRYVHTLSLDENMQNKLFDLYEQSFPPFECRTRDVHYQAVDDDRFYPMAVYNDDEFIGLLFYWLIDGICYIEHLAIAADSRGKGYGTLILKDFCSLFNNIVLEIDPPIEDVSIARERFYHHLGFITSKFDYIHPSYREEYIPHTLVLMKHKNDMAEDEFERFKNIMFNDIMKYSGKAKS